MGKAEEEEPLLVRLREPLPRPAGVPADCWPVYGQAYAVRRAHYNPARPEQGMFELETLSAALRAHQPNARVLFPAVLFCQEDELRDAIGPLLSLL